MKALLVLLLIIWLAVSLAGALIEGLLWLLVIGIVLLLVTAAWGWFTLRRSGGGPSRPPAG